ncbi:Holliday junction resolvase RecU [Aneurinibacillus migulanus]|uniref:Holliday junction resolvase RecU n=1 Tax=Aneurinibacillus migulanus TaxID=47500 RepID=UPI00209E201D|nr:Holliday junction resolvase RecU [Aneurinibacillus migulanus]MCP1356801.1 Holliday junction resolvase RecU [Aneurinibacillus migulanus]
MSTKQGKLFEADIEQSCKEQKVFYHRIKDIFIPVALRQKVQVPINKYDSIIFYNGYLFPIEFKSTKQKSISFSPKIIKTHQIQYLKEATEYEKTIPGFIFNFRIENNNSTYFIHIDEFIAYKNATEGNDTKITYQSKINKSSIPLDICREIGVEVKNVKKEVRYRYYINDLCKRLIAKYK